MAFNSEWENLAVVGRGGSSTVYKAVLKLSGKFVAVKQIEIDGLSRDQINGIKGEIETMKDLSHPNILCYLGTQQSPNRVFIFLEYADRGSLRQFYQNNGPLTEPQISFCLQGILAGLNYLHSNGIAHRDIKCANCLLCSEGVVKLADFGASKRFESDSIVSGLKGTPHWMAPEVIKGTQMTTGWIKADVWSLGCAVVEMFTAKVPYAEYENPMTAMYKIASGEIPSLKPSSVQPDTASTALVSFIHTCCNVDPTARPGAEELLSHPFVIEEVEDVGDLFAEAAPAPLATAERSASRESHSDDFRATGGNTTNTSSAHNVRNSTTMTAGHGAIADIPLGSRSRADSHCSLMSGDDETTIANAAEASYTDDDFCSYGSTGYSNTGYDTTGQSDINAGMREQSADRREYHASGAATPVVAIGMGVGIGESQEILTSSADAHNREGANESAGENRPGRSLVAGGPPLAARSTSRSRSRGHTRPAGMAINTGTTSTGDLESSAGGLEDLLTPALHKGPVRGASVQLQMMPMLGKQVRELTLSDRATPVLTRKWSDTAFLDVSQDNASQEKAPASTSSSDNSVAAEVQKIEPLTSAVSVSSSSAPRFEVPTYESASEVYKSMMMKYSPRAKDSQAPNFQALEAEIEPEPVAPKSIAGEETSDNMNKNKRDEAVQRGTRANSQSATTSNQDFASYTDSRAPTAVTTMPSKATPMDSLGAEPLQQPLQRESSFKVEPLKELRPIVKENGKRKQKIANPHENTVAPRVFGGESNMQSASNVLLNVESTDRPYAPLSGEKLRLHTFTEPSRKASEPGGAPVSSSEALDRLSNSGAAAVRKIAAQELREVSDRRHGHGTHGTDNVQRIKGQAKGKGTVVHHTTKALKRSHHQMSPRGGTHISPANAQTQQLLRGGQYLNNQNTAESVVVGPIGGVRSQSAGVNLSCEGGGHAHTNRKDARQKLPPVLRGMMRGGASSSSGNIAPIEEGRTLRADSDSVGMPMMLMDPGAGPPGRYIQSAPAVSRSLNLPPIDGAARHGHRQGASIDSSSGVLGVEDSALLTSLTPNAKQPRVHRFGRPTVPNGVSEILQQSFANAMKGYSHGDGSAHE